MRSYPSVPTKFAGEWLNFISQGHPQHHQEDCKHWYSAPTPFEHSLIQVSVQGNASKTQALVDEHKSKGKTPEELVELKIINADQKKQVDNLNSLKAEVARLEEQLAQYEKIDAEYRAQVASVKADIEKSHEQDRADAVAEVKKQAEEDAKKSLHDGLLVLSQFLRLAAHRRAEAPESTEDEDQALEGILLGVYGGDEPAVNVMLRLCEGTEDKTVSVGGETLQTTC